MAHTTYTRDIIKASMSSDQGVHWVPQNIYYIRSPYYDWES